MSNQRYYSGLLIGLSCVLTGLLASNLVVAADKLTLTVQEANEQQAHRVDQKSSLRQVAMQKQTVNPLEVQITTPIDVIEPLCNDIAQAAVDLGHEPVRPCRDQPSNLVTDEEYNALLEAQANAAAQLEAELAIENAANEHSSSLVLLVHGFSMSSGHDCNEYWQVQKEAIEAQGLTALIVGFYAKNNNGCDVDLAAESGFTSFTPIDTIAREMRDWIVHNHGGTYIRIVAHSMGGIVVRRMLQNWGHELLVSDVITLGTPHAGVKTFHFNGSCAIFTQCRQMSAGSGFMKNLQHNPQSIVPTQWTLIGAADDQVIGYHTALQMSHGNAGGPAVSTHHYELKHKHDCFQLATTMGHGDLHGANATLPVYNCDVYGFSQGSLLTPHERIMAAVGLGG